jgi:type IV secretory pathway TrbL component
VEGGGWSRDAVEEVGPEMAIESTQGSPRRCGRKEAWWEEGVGEAKSAASRSGDRTQRKAAGSAGSTVGAGITTMHKEERSVSWSGQQ